MGSILFLFSWYIMMTIAANIPVNGYRNNRHQPYEKKRSSRPNIVLILADDQGWNDVGWNNPDVITPHLNWLARHGVILNNSYVQPMCSPSRAAILTGKYPHRLGLQWSVIGGNQPKFVPRKTPMLAEKLRQKGYRTHITGKWHLGHCSDDLIPTSRGFDSFFGILRGWSDYFTRILDWSQITMRSSEQGASYDFWRNENVYLLQDGSYNTDLFTEEAVKIIDAHDQKKSPMFLYLPYTSPHFPLQVPQPFKNLYQNETDTKRQTYLGMVSSLDFSVGRVVTALKRNGFMDNTVIIYLSDNGGAQNFGGSNLPLRGDKSDLWEGGTKSVGFVYSPKFLGQQGCIHPGMIHAVDWFPTILDIAGHNQGVLSKIDGVSQWQYIKQCYGSARNEFVYNIDDFVAKSAAIRVGDYKLILGDPRVNVFDPITNHPVPIDPNNREVRLFNLKSDPSEGHNLASEMPDQVILMIRKLHEYRRDSIAAQNPINVSPNITDRKSVV